MKFWKKIFLYTVTLTAILITATGVIFIERLHYSNLERTVIDAINNQKNIISSIYLSYDNSLFPQYYNGVSDNFELILRSYAYSDANNIENVQIFTIEDKLIASINEYKPRGVLDFLDSIDSYENIFTFRDDNGKKILLIGSEFKVQDNNYKLVLIKGIDYLFKERQENYKFFFILSIITSSFLICGMYIIAKRITKPIDNLAQLSINISKGQYDKRSEDIYRNDEVGILANNFNEMLEALQSKMNELEEINIEKERFINNLTHEIKTPITSIIGYSDLLLRANINNDIREKSLTYINNAGHMLENLSSTLIKLTRIKNEKLELEKVNISDSIDKSINLLRDKIESKNITLNINLYANENSIIADKQLIILLIKNILENAIKASRYNNEIYILTFKNDEGLYVIKIKDYGVGIPKEDLGKILEPFYMVDKARDRSQNGMGLGLSICNEICSQFNIKLSICSEENIGTEVTLTFDDDVER